MKKIKILLLATFVVAGMQSAYSQAEVALGIKGGLNFANVNTSSTAAAYNSRTGYHAGAFLLMKFAKFGLQPEVIYSQQGTTVKFNSQNLDQNFSYINIPIMLKLYLVGGLNLQAGPQFGFLSKASSETYNPLTGAKTTEDVKDKLKGSDISIGLGAGWDLPFGLNIDARYNLGVSDNNNDSSGPTTKNQVFQLSAGFKLFKFGK
jgi:Outer membrane protein beta-barrel domain